MYSRVVWRCKLRYKSYHNRFYNNGTNATLQRCAREINGEQVLKHSGVPPVEMANLKHILEKVGFEEKYSEIISGYIEDATQDLKKQIEERVVTKAELQELNETINNEILDMQKMFEELSYKDRALIKKEIELLNNKILVSQASINEIIDSLNHYATLEHNEHVNLRKSDVRNLIAFSEKRMVYFTDLLNRLRVSAEKDKLESAPQIIWAVTTILISLTISYAIFPSSTSSEQ